MPWALGPWLHRKHRSVCICQLDLLAEDVTVVQ